MTLVSILHAPMTDLSHYCFLHNFVHHGHFYTFTIPTMRSRFSRPTEWFLDFCQSLVISLSSLLNLRYCINTTCLNLGIRFTHCAALLMLDHTCVHRAFHPYYIPTPLSLIHLLIRSTLVELPFYHDANVASMLIRYLVTNFSKVC